MVGIKTTKIKCNTCTVVVLNCVIDHFENIHRINLMNLQIVQLLLDNINHNRYYNWQLFDLRFVGNRLAFRFIESYCVIIQQAHPYPGDGV